MICCGEEREMLTVRGTYRNGTAIPEEVIEGREGKPVLIPFLEENDGTAAGSRAADWSALRQLLEECKVDTGIPDLAHEHDHYLYGKPRKGS
jgi:hypothetical protein